MDDKTVVGKPKKPPAMVACARCKRVILKSESCSVRTGRNCSRVCQPCIRMTMGMMMGLKPKEPDHGR